MKQRPARWRTITTGVVLFAQFAVALSPAVSSAQTTGAQRPPIQRGQEYYEQSRFDEAITLLRDLVDRGQLVGEDLQKARELLARSYVKKGYPVQAKEMFKAILRTMPDWRPDPIKVPPDETAVFDQSLKEFQTEGAAPPTPAPATPAPAKRDSAAAVPPSVAKPTTPRPAPVMTPVTAGGKKSKTLWYVLGGVVVVGAIAAAAGGGGGDGAKPPPAAAFNPWAGFPGPPGP